MLTNYKSYLFSIFIHTLIIIFLFLVKFQIEVNHVPEIIEVIALETIVIPKPQPAKQNISRPTQLKRQDSQTISQPQLAQAQQIEVPEVTIPDFEPVDISSLPQRSSRNIQSDLYKASIDDTLMQAKINHTKLTATTSSTDAHETSGTSTTRFNPSSSLLDIGLEGLAEYIKNSKGNYSGYQLEGEIINRTIVTKVLPDFPDNVRKNGTVTIQFTVVQSGRVENIIIVKKADPEFELASRNAHGQWLFNSADQSHTGIITFHFRLE